ncbi:hypothetical protein Cob_v007973 [Colletotrichum orbiculare MAFF 240422]|uniref:Uncharacterized protein n=1 Tax=Colletotrichum orbiculare (strain 104-T / ATCC 96160 / CBS 514.97 / LARS 414 / MAFF 240422) TaxID=1213857 RepID=A0A484FNI2_COLOR|nr:hypothetical protein Cob_v007973 [Colletotrichum orbiculare MAFF 240422]
MTTRSKSLGIFVGFLATLSSLFYSIQALCTRRRHRGHKWTRMKPHRQQQDWGFRPCGWRRDNITYFWLKRASFRLDAYVFSLE